MTELVSRRPTVFVRMYAGHWVIDCPLCRGAQVVLLGERCVDCGIERDVRWPAPEMRLGVERLMSLRPVPHTRNWSPGESLTDLLAENVAHGIGPTEVGQSISIAGDSILRDSLPAGRRLQIGA